MKILNTELAEHYCDTVFNGKSNRDAFKVGCAYTEQKLIPNFVEFVRWCMNGYYTLSEEDIWIPNDYELSKDSVNWKKTEELFFLWLEEQNKQ